MLEGRGQQQQMCVRTRVAQQKALLEEEFRRKVQVVVAVVSQRLAQEKAELRLKQERPLSTPAVLPSSGQPQQQQSESVQPLLAAELASRLELVLEERLAKIEALVATHSQSSSSPVAIPSQPEEEQKQSGSDDSEVSAYRASVAEAVAAGCRYEKRQSLAVGDPLASSAFGVLDAGALDESRLPRAAAEQIDERMRARREFVTLLLQLVASKDVPEEATLTVVERFRSDSEGHVGYVSFSSPKKSDKSSGGTLYLSLAALQELSTGQLAVVVLHALAQARAHTSDLTEPRFISQLYALLVRCYQGLFAHVQQPRAAGTTAMRGEQPRKSLGGGVSSTTSEKLQWHVRLQEMEGFLARLDSEQMGAEPADSTQRSSSSRWNLLAMERGASYKGSAGEAKSEASAAMDTLSQQEQTPLLQEKLDTTEKLYMQVLRQHEQQTQTLEYWQDLLAEQCDAEYEEDAFDEKNADEGGQGERRADPEAVERQQQREARAQEAQIETDRAAQALEATRTERDELFAQCQQLRDQLTLLRGRLLR